MSTSQDARDRPEELFERLADLLTRRPLVESGTGFGSMPGLRVHHKIFVMLCRGELVVKLPQVRVDSLVEQGVASRFDAGQDGRRMKQWAAVPPAHSDAWPGLADEAMQFVAAGSRAGQRTDPIGSRRAAGACSGTAGRTGGTGSTRT